MKLDYFRIIFFYYQKVGKFLYEINHFSKKKDNNNNRISI